MCRWGNSKCGQIYFGLWVGIAPLLVLLKLWLVCSYVCLLNVCTVVHRVTANVLALGAVADFGAQNCQYTTKVDAR